ncbi:MAG: amino acid adenylation domain-containing protein, partial [bacterium]|nr:amino acid adenylation domain-containing protein [bacterium]
KLFILPKGAEKETGAISDAIGRQCATTVDFVPAMLKVFLDYLETQGTINELLTLRWVFVGAETLHTELTKAFYRIIGSHTNARLINAYGPTEATVDVTWFDCAAAGDYETVPIGKPMANTTLLILDKHYTIQPVGIPGELCIAGTCLAAGYLNRPELTSEKFVKNEKVLSPPGPSLPYNQSTLSGNYFYKTGDRAKWLPDGNIEFLGRIDQQVKVRGFRIELGEIENSLLTHPGIKEAVVIARQSRNGDGENTLCAYIVTKHGEQNPETGSPAAVTPAEYLAQTLPPYMIPAHFVQLEKIPLTANGKVDKKVLPPPGIKKGHDFTAPRNHMEEKLAELWAE